MDKTHFDLITDVVLIIFLQFGELSHCVMCKDHVAQLSDTTLDLIVAYIVHHYASIKVYTLMLVSIKMCLMSVPNEELKVLTLCDIGCVVLAFNVTIEKGCIFLSLFVLGKYKVKKMDMCIAPLVENSRSHGVVSNCI